MKRKIVWLVVSCMMVAALILASCAPAVPEEEKPTTPTTSTTPTTPTTPTAPAEGKEMVKDVLGQLKEKPRYGGSITKVPDQQWLGFDDLYTQDSALPTNHLVCEKLVIGDLTLGPLGKNLTAFEHPGGPSSRSILTGRLAESWETPDPTTPIWHIRKNVYWQNKPPVNGRQMTAEDVLFSLKRIFTEPPRSYALNACGAPPLSIEISKDDPWTIIVKTTPAAAIETYAQVSGVIMIVAPEVIEKYGDYRDWRNIVGTGPFIIKDYVSGSQITFERSPNYWGKDPFFPDNQLPYVDEAREILISDIATRLAALRTGKLDIQELVDPDDAKSLMKTNPELKYKEKLLHNANTIHMRNDTKPFDDVRVRKALAMAIDRQAIVNDYYDGRAEILSCPVGRYGEFSDVYVPLEELPESTREIFEYHPDKAKQLLAEAGYPNGFETNIITENDQERIEQLSIVQGYWQKNLNVNCAIDVKESSICSAIRKKLSHTQMMYYNLNTGSWLKFNRIDLGTAQNLSMTNDEYINKVALDVKSHWNDEAYAHAAARAALPYEHAQVWYIQFPVPYQYTFWQPWVNGFGGEYCIGYKWRDYQPAYVWIDQDLKEQMTGKR